jgi:hypothetical protein
VGYFTPFNSIQFIQSAEGASAFSPTTLMRLRRANRRDGPQKWTSATTPNNAATDHGGRKALVGTALQPNATNSAHWAAVLACSSFSAHALPSW